MVGQNFFTQGIRSVFTLDLRALALLRIALSFVLMADLIFRFADLKAFYTGGGVLPLEALFRHHWDPFYFSLFTTNDNHYLQTLLFAVNFLCVFCLLIGYRTKLFSILVWIFLISIHNRNPLVMQAGDHLLRMLVFWGIFLPWGYLFSVDSRKTIFVEKRHSFESFAGFAYICQIAFLYYFSALIKSSAEWRSDFTALYYALSIDQITRPIGELLYPHYDLLKALTAGTFYLELILPLFLFIPFYNAWFRMVTIVATVMLQMGIFATMNVGLFSAISMVMMIGIIPGSFLDWISSRFSRSINALKGLGRRLASRFRSKTKEQLAPPKPSLSSEIVVTLALIYVLGWNLQTIGKKAIPDSLLWVGSLFKLQQHWAMFAPTVYKDDGWFIYQGTTEDGREIDLLKDGSPVTYEKAERVADLVKSDRWRKYGENIIMKSNIHFRPYFCNFLLNEWNSANPESPVAQLNVIYMHERTLPNYQTAEIDPWNICSCSADP